MKQANTCARSAVTTSLSVSAGASRIVRTPGRSRFSSSTSVIAPLTGRAASVTTTSSGRKRASCRTSSAPRHVSTVWPWSAAISRSSFASAVIGSDDQDSAHQFVHPPSTTETVPVVKADSSDAR